MGLKLLDVETCEYRPGVIIVAFDIVATTGPGRGSRIVDHANSKQEADQKMAAWAKANPTYSFHIV